MSCLIWYVYNIYSKGLYLFWFHLRAVILHGYTSNVLIIGGEGVSRIVRIKYNVFRSGEL